MTLIINAQIVKSVAVAISTEETRYYLNGIYFEPGPAGAGVRAVATDGHRMMVAFDPEGTLTGEPFILPISKALLGKLRVRKNRKWFIYANGVASVVEIPNAPKDFSLQDEMEKGVKVSDFAIAMAPTRPIDGTYPDWRRVLPNMEKAKPACGGYAPNVLAPVLSALEEYVQSVDKGSGAILRAEDDGSPTLAVMPGYPEIFGVVMPMRIVGSIEALPDWVNS